MLTPQRYIKNNNLQRDDFAATLTKFSSFFTWGYKDEYDVLDVGCGTGDATRDVLLPSLKCKTPRIVGVDVSQAMVDFARENCKNSFDFHVMDIATSKDPRAVFPNGFDKIYSSYCLHWVLDQRRAMKNMYDLLTPKGEILLLFITNTVNFVAEKKIITNNKWSKYLKNFPVVSMPYETSKNPADEIKRLMQLTGFTVPSCNVLEKFIIFQTRKNFKDFLTSVSAYQHVIPDEKMDEFISDIVEELRDAEQDDGTFLIKYKTIEVFARK